MKIRRTIPSSFVFVLSSLFLSACSHSPSAPPYMADVDAAPDGHFDASAIPDAVPRIEPRSRYGNPDSYVVFGQRYRVLDTAENFRERGLASWYGTRFHGRRTSSGEPYDMYAMTAAHKSLPLPAYVRVTNLENDRSVVVRVNDRGPFHEGRVIDLSYAAALKLGVVATGTAPVEIVALDPERIQSPEARVAAATDANATQHAVSAVAEDKPSDDNALLTEAGDTLFIQLGAFSSEDNALGLKGELETAGIRPVRINPEPEQALFRVRVGPFAAAGAADEVALRLVALGITEFNIINE